MDAHPDGRGLALTPFTRRAALGAIGGALVVPRPALASPVFALSAETRTIDVDGKAASVLTLAGDQTLAPVRIAAGARFTTRLVNALDEPTLIHWHGQTPPTDQDGVPVLSQPALGPGAAHDYDFAPRPGTHWMHSHVGLQEQRLLAAPLIVEAPGDGARDEQEVVLFLQDYTFRPPEAILAELMAGGGAHAAHGMRALNDVEHDAFLANGRTLGDPEVVIVEPDGWVRLRVINAAAATNFWLDLGALDGAVTAVDGNDVEPVVGSMFPLAIAQRLDVTIRLPGPGAWPILALREGGTERAGIVLAKAGANVARVATRGKESARAIDLSLERVLRPLAGLPAREPSRALQVDLSGGVEGYRWGIDGAPHGEHATLRILMGDRVHLTMRNATAMAHPMHLHGHHFQVVAIDGAPIQGAMRDTVLVPIDGTVTIAFDADNPGRWALHCHNLYHMNAGMMTEVAYES
jgi:FtsP/CotA-like multicopper oxidase with cupredoxin domain